MLNKSIGQKQFRRIGKDYLGQIIVFAYKQDLSKNPLMEVLKELKLTA
ncbi:hypothetical protein JOC34_001346 [Virgibacillus halotolerans]|nr:hypothetical protein [Virgibacillus halotolerans]